MLSNANEIIVPDAERFGFCRGVEAAHQALSRVSDVAARFNIPRVYGYHDIVHNDDVTRYHEERGVVFVDALSDIPNESIVVGSAHGSSPEVMADVLSRESLFFDAACPLVLHTHKAVEQARQNGEAVIYLLSGKPGVAPKIHDEVKGTVGHMDYYFDESGQLVHDPLERYFVELSDDPQAVAKEALARGTRRFRLVGQTTLLATASIGFKESLKSAIEKNDPTSEVQRADRRDVCFAVEERQEGVRVLLSRKPDSVVVVTDKNSKNGMGYVKLAEQVIEEQGLDTVVHAVANETELGEDIKGAVAVTASASTPDAVTREVVLRLGGDQNLVPYSRPSFNLRGCSEKEIEETIQRWLKN